MALFGCDGGEPTVDAARTDGGPTGRDGGRADGGGTRPDASTDGGPDGSTAPPTDGGTPSACALPTPFDVGATYERTLHVATTGSDAADGSAGAPLATLREAARRATPGTRILLAAGTYRGSTFLSNVFGEPTRPIAIVGDGEAILDGGGASEVLHLAEARYVVLEGLTIQNATVNGLNIDDGGSYETPAEHVVLRDLTVRNVGTGGNNDCIKLSGVDRFFVLGSDISACNAGDAIDMVGCHEGVIAGNHIHDALGGGIQAKGGSADTLIHGNRFVDVVGRSINAGGSTGLEFFRPIDAPHEAARLRVVANVFVRAGAACRSRERSRSRSAMSKACRSPPSTWRSAACAGSRSPPWTSRWRAWPARRSRRSRSPVASSRACRSRPSTSPGRAWPACRSAP